MHCLVTGGAGFIGQHLTSRLLTDGHQVTVVDNLARASTTTLAQIKQGIKFVPGDIRDERCVARAVRQAEVVFHLAAQAQVMSADLDPDYTFSTNVTGTINVLRAATRVGVRRVVFASSREVYGEPAVLPVDEAQPPNPKNGYGASKVAAEAYCRTLGNTGSMSTVILRLTNTYGPGDHGRLIPIWLQRASEGLDLEMYGGYQVLDLIPVSCVVEAFLAAAQSEVLSTAINVGSGQGLRLREVARRVLEVTGSPSRVVVRPPRLIEVERFVADVRRMTVTLGVLPPAEPLADLENMVRQPAALRTLPGLAWAGASQ